MLVPINPFLLHTFDCIFILCCYLCIPRSTKIYFFLKVFVRQNSVDCAISISTPLEVALVKHKRMPPYCGSS